MPDFDKSDLERLYHEEDLNQREIGELIQILEKVFEYENENSSKNRIEDAYENLRSQMREELGTD